MSFAVIRLRGTVNIKPKIKMTLELLNLNRVNHCVIIPQTPEYKGMLQIVKDYVTWGEIEPEMLARLMMAKGKAVGKKDVDDDLIKEHSEYKSVIGLSKSIIGNKVKYTDLEWLSPVMRLHPPQGGHRSIKRAYKNKGDLGYRGKDINKLVEKMLAPKPKKPAPKKVKKKAGAKKVKKPVVKAKPRKKPVKKAKPKPKKKE